MKRSDRILRKNHVQSGLSWEREKIIENNLLLKHIIDNDIKIIWRWIFAIVGLVVGLYLKSLLIVGGG